MKHSSKNPNPIDRQVGANIRRLREAAKVSQTTLGNAIGVQFQQIQKYETAQNRIAASRLLEAAFFLKVPVQNLFEGCVTADGSACAIGRPANATEDGFDPLLGHTAAQG